MVFRDIRNWIYDGGEFKFGFLSYIGSCFLKGFGGSNGASPENDPVKIILRKVLLDLFDKVETRLITTGKDVGNSGGLDAEEGGKVGGF